MLQTALLLWSVVAATALVYASAPATFSGFGSAQQSFPVRDDDLIVVIGSTHSRLVLAQATRAWRSGIRTYIATNTTPDAELYSKAYADFLEVYEAFPDEHEEDRRLWKARNAGDFRAGFVPWLAHRYYKGQYKWMLFGDDDTLFFMPGVRRLLAQFDPEVPLAISDNLWWAMRHPMLEAPRCVPCGYDTSVIAEQQRKTYVPRPGCPHCTRELACPPNKTKCEFVGAHGGAGVLVSVALMRQISYESAYNCMNETTGCSGSDCLFSKCVWQAGYGFTDPGYALRFERPLEHVLFDNMENRWAVKSPADQLITKKCNRQCRDWLKHIVSFHLRGRSHTSFMRAAAVMFALTESHKAALDYIHLKEELDAELGTTAHDTDEL